MVPRVNVLGVGISAIDPPAALDLIAEWIETRQRHYICVCAVHIVMECRQDAALRSMVNRASLAVPDGMPLVWVSRLAGERQVKRVYGPDLMLSVCRLSAERGYTSYLLGGAPGQPQVVAEKLASQYPGLAVIGTRATPVRPVPPAETEQIIDEVNRANPDVVWVGMGTPYQERWMAEYRERLTAPILIGVGAAFDFHSRHVRQAPDLLQRMGLEWLFRLSQEPRRLWRRYLVGNPRFVAMLVAQRLGLRHYELDQGTP